MPLPKSTLKLIQTEHPYDLKHRPIINSRNTLQDYKEITFPPIAGNTLRFLYFLKASGAVHLSDEHYRNFVILYEKAADKIKKEDIEKIQEIFNAIEIKFSGLIRLMGNTFSGMENGNDAYTLLLLDALNKKSKDLKFEIILGPFDCFFLKFISTGATLSLLQMDEFHKKNGLHSISEFPSLGHLIFILNTKIIHPEQILKIFHGVISPSLRLFSYSKTGENEVSLFTSGKTDYKTLLSLFDYYGIHLIKPNLDELINTLSEANSFFTDSLSENGLNAFLKIFFEQLSQFSSRNRFQSSHPTPDIIERDSIYLRFLANEVVTREDLSSEPRNFRLVGICTSKLICDEERSRFLTLETTANSPRNSFSQVLSCNLDSELTEAETVTPFDEQQSNEPIVVLDHFGKENDKIHRFPLSLLDIPQARIFEIGADSNHYTAATGDLHGNAILLLQFLIREGVLEISNEDYQEFIKIYLTNPKNYPPNTRKILDAILNRCQFHPNRTSLIFIGDIFSDRGSNDGITAEIFLLLKKHHINYRIIPSNHDLEFWLKLQLAEQCIPEFEKDKEFIETLKKNPDAKNYVFASVYKKDHTLTEPFAASSHGLADSIINGFTTHERICEMILTAYIPSLTFIPYRIINEDEIVLFTHAPAGLEYIESLIQSLNSDLEKLQRPRIVLDLSSVHTFAKTLDHINESLRVYSLSDLFALANRCSHELKHSDRTSKHPYFYGLFNRARNEIRSGAPLNLSYRITFIHGHDGPENKPDCPNHFSIDSDRGKEPSWLHYEIEARNRGILMTHNTRRDYMAWRSSHRPLIAQASSSNERTVAMPSTRPLNAPHFYKDHPQGRGDSAQANHSNAPSAKHK